MSPITLRCSESTHPGAVEGRCQLIYGHPGSHVVVWESTGVGLVTRCWEDDPAMPNDDAANEHGAFSRPPLSTLPWAVSCPHPAWTG
jgi:hypothetical protein